MAGRRQAVDQLDAPTVTIRKPSTQQAPAQPVRHQASLFAVIGGVAAGVAAIVGVSAAIGGETVSPAAPVAVAPAVPTPLSAEERIDASLAGLQAGLSHRATWGDDLTRENITQPCEVQASGAYPSSPAAAQVFATNCVNNALG